MTDKKAGNKATALDQAAELLAADQVVDQPIGTPPGGGTWKWHGGEWVKAHSAND